MSRGRLRVYIGAAPGVGKTYAALEEVGDLVKAGVDAVVGYVETHGRKETEDLLFGLEVLPRRQLTYGGVEFEEMDTKIILDRDPAVVLIDELAHTNVPGSGHPKRWQDVDDVLERGIDVISTINIQHFESLNDVVADITGVVQRETIPDETVRRADEIHLVDLPQQTVRNRLAAGKIYPAERIDAALSNFFRPGNLGALRELALSWTADRVDEAVDQYRRDHGIHDRWDTRERVVVGITGEAGGSDTIRRAARMAMRSKGELLGVYVRPADGIYDNPTPELQHHRELVERLGGEYHEVAHADVGESLVTFARAHNATQLVLGATRRGRIQELFTGSVIQRVLRLSGDIDVHVISNPTKPRARVRVRASPLPRRRRALGWLFGAASFFVATQIMLARRDEALLENVLLVYLSIAAVTAWIGGVWPALTAAVAGFLLGNYLFTPPFETWTIAEPSDVFALAAFVFLAGLVGFLVGSAARRSAEASTAKAEAETLAGLIRASGEGSVNKLLERLNVGLGTSGVSLFLPGPLGPRLIAGAGENPPSRPDDADRLTHRGDAIIAISGATLDAADERLLAATLTELGTVIDRVELAEHAAEVDALGRTNELRTALLRTVSHDLRSPLSVIQASVTSLLQDDVHWPAEEERQFLETINEETIRLNRVVSDLLDAGRLQTGTLRVTKRRCGIEEVVSAVATTFGNQRHRLSVDTEEDLPDVSTDPVLLERIVENLVRNALEHSPPTTPVRIAAGVVGDHVDLRVIDRGPGIEPDVRQQVFEPFRSLDDGQAAGVGLGLSVARGLADALEHPIEIDDTPGGGTTMIVTIGLFR